MNPEKADITAKPPASILVIDDTPANLQVLAGMLKERGYKVRPVPSGQLALQAARRDPPDLILLDINMPEMNGYEVCKHLKADSALKGIPVIFISALTEQLDKVKAFATGGVDYITKPFQMEELQARVETHLKLHRLQTDLQEYSDRLEIAHGRLSRDLELASAVQREFLPQKLPQVPDYEFFAHYQPASEVGSDYYDFIELPGGRVAMLLGTVNGTGVAAALFMAKLCADARYCMLTEPDAAAAFTSLNSLMNQSGLSRRSVTLVAAVLDSAAHTMTLVNAGHPSPLIYHRTSRTVEEAIGVVGAALGAQHGFQYTSCQISLEPGDTILAFTDGFTEAGNLQDLQPRTEAIYAALRGKEFHPNAMGEQVVNVIKKFTIAGSQQNDVVVVGFGRIS